MSNHAFVSSFVKTSARAHAAELAEKVSVHLAEASNGFEVTCGKRLAVAAYDPDPSEQCRHLDNAVEIVMGLREVTP
jgi:hypothetical protein